MPNQRPPINPGKGLNSVQKDWKSLLVNSEQTFLTDNQLSAFVDREHPGCAATHFYPLPFPHKFTGGKWSWEELAAHDNLRSIGPVLDFTPDKTEMVFLPHLIQKNMRSGDTVITERCAVYGDTLLIEWNITGMDSAHISFSLPCFSAGFQEFDESVLLSVEDQVFVNISIAGSSSLAFTTAENPAGIEAEIGIVEGRKIYLALSCGYDSDQVAKSAQMAIDCPESIFRAAEETWNDYFTKVVPNFSCSDSAIEQLYYYQAYATRANLYDIPYEPFIHPYTCPWKTGAVWQWSWNTPMNSICERWLNDKRIGAGGILLEGENGGGLNIGTYLHPTEKVTKLRGHVENHDAVSEYYAKLPLDFDLKSITTMPHTTPNGLLGAWEFYLCSGDEDFLKKALSIMVEAEAEFSKHEAENGLCATAFVDEFDYSLRLKPFCASFSKGDPCLMFKMDTPFIAVDYNCYLYALRNRIIQAAGILNATDVDADMLIRKNARLKRSINEFLWDETDGFYYDADPNSMKLSGVKCIAGFRRYTAA